MQQSSISTCRCNRHSQEFEQQVIADLSVLKSQMGTLLGSGHGGRIRELEARVEHHEAIVQRWGGVTLVLAFLLSMMHLALDYAKAFR